jgi:hypothetical protein
MGIGSQATIPLKKFAMSARVLGMPVMCGTLESPSATEARTAWETKFWSDVEDLRAAIPAMDDTNRQHAEKMLTLMEATRADARQYGLVVTARPSKAVRA